MRLSNFHLCIGVPCTFPFIPSSFFYSYALMEKPDHTFVHADNGPVDTLRNDIVDKALAIGASHVIMLDVDMIYHPKTITRLLSHRLPIVGAMSYRRYLPFDTIMLKVRPNKTGYDSVDEWAPIAMVQT